VEVSASIAGLLPSRRTLWRMRPGLFCEPPTAARLTVLVMCIAFLGACSGDDVSSRPGTDHQVSTDSCSTDIDKSGVDPSRSASDPATVPSSASADSNAPEVATRYRSGLKPVRTESFAVSTAHPLATRAACEVLRDGGTAADALVVAQTMLGLVEPQSSGIGGGGFVLYYDARSRTVTSYDGRETAPTAATSTYLSQISDTDPTPPRPDTRASGRSIGVPGVVRLLESVQSDHGQSAWKDLLGPATEFAAEGFEVSPRLAASIAASAPSLARDPDASATYLHDDGTGIAAGEVLDNPGYASTLRVLAQDGPDAFYRGPLAESIVERATSTEGGTTPSLMTAADLAGYRAVEREPVCAPYRSHTVCGMGPPSSGGIAVAQTLGILAGYPLDQYPPTDMDRNGGRPSVDGVHLISEAERLAYADSDAYVADTDFVALPGGSPDRLLDPEYLRSRAGLIDMTRSMGAAEPGDVGSVPTVMAPVDEHGTSHISVIDRYGNAASMTTSIESSFGSFHMVGGFMLNNQLTDFSAQPNTPEGASVANRIEPNKRPRSSMAPTLVFEGTGTKDRLGPLELVAGSPGGAVIPQYVTKTLVGILDWGMDPQQAVGMADFGAANSPVTNVGGEHPNVDERDDGAQDPLVQGLRSRGHRVAMVEHSSGLSAIMRDPDHRRGWIGGADPRREGVVMGDVRG